MESWVLKTEGKNLRTGQETYLLAARFTTEVNKLLFWVGMKNFFFWMNKPIKQNKNPPKAKKPKGPVTLGRTTFIDEILKKTESQPSVGFKRTTSR